MKGMKRMNKPKFRAWDNVNKIMVTDFNGRKRIENPDGFYMHSLDVVNGNEIYAKLKFANRQEMIFRPFKEMSLMQYTGLKDKKGVEACQGNYLTREGRWTFFIEWLDEYGCLMAVPVNPIQRTNWEPVPIKRILEMGFVNDGNVHTNPELLNEVE